MGLGKSIGNSLTVLGSISDDLIDKKDQLNLTDINELRFLPIFRGIVNHINRYTQTVKSWDFSESNFRQKSKDLLVLNIDNLFSKERNKTLELLNTGKIFSLGFNKINQTDEIMFGSSSVEST
jgi:uncharacterized protein YqhQ